VVEHCRAIKKSLCFFFELLLNVSGSKYDSNRLIVIDKLSSDFDSISAAHNTRRLSYPTKCTIKSYFCRCYVFEVDVNDWPRPTHDFLRLRLS